MTFYQGSVFTYYDRFLVWENVVLMAAAGSLVAHFICRSDLYRVRHLVGYLYLVGDLCSIKCLHIFTGWSSPHFRPGGNYESKLPLKIGIRPDGGL